MSHARVNNILKYSAAGAVIGVAMALDCAQPEPAGIKLAGVVGFAEASICETIIRRPLTKIESLLLLSYCAAPAILWYRGLDALLGKAKAPALIAGGAIVGGLCGAVFSKGTPLENNSLNCVDESDLSLIRSLDCKP